MSTLPPPADSHAPDAPAKEETLAAHAKRSLLTKIRSRIGNFLDKGIALLQGLRKHAAGEPAPREDEGNTEARRDRPRERRGSPQPEAAAAEAPKPKRRLRAILIYASVLLAGGLGGGALAYHQFQKQLGLQLEERLRLEAVLAEKTRPSAETLKAFEAEQARRIEAAEKLTAAFAEFTESTADSYALLESLLGQQVAESRRLETALAERTQASAVTQKALEEAQARRAETEQKLASLLVSQSNSSGAAPIELSAEERKMARRLAREIERNAQREARANRQSGSRPRPDKTADCTLEATGVDSLKNCLNDFNQ